jgi:hypothetical protein
MRLALRWRFQLSMALASVPLGWTARRWPARSLVRGRTNTDKVSGSVSRWHLRVASCMDNGCVGP